MKLTQVNGFSNQTTIQQITQYLSVMYTQLQQIINGGIILSDNVSSQIISISFNVANTEVKMPHNLGRIPSAVIPFNLSANMVIYNGTTGNDASNIYLKSSSAGTASMLLF